MTQLYPDPFGAPWRLPWLRMMLQWKGGILQIFLLEWLCAITVCALVILAVYLAWKDNPPDLTVSHNIYSLIEATTFVARRFQAAIALMLGFYSMQNFNRWREVRNVEGNAMGNINDLALQIAWRLRGERSAADSKARPETSPEEKKDSGPETPRNDIANVTGVRLKLIRWLNLSHALVVGDVYDGKNEFAFLENLVKYGLATKEECAFLKSFDSRYKYVAPYLWFIDLVESLERKELYGVNEGTVNLMASGIVGVRRMLADLHGLCV